MDERKRNTHATLETVLNHIQQGRVVPCYLLCGDEEYLVKHAFQKIITALLPGDDTSLNLFIMDGDTVDSDAIGESLLTMPLIPGRKVVAVKNTTLLYSKASIPAVVREVTANIEREPRKAAKAFGTFLSMAGWTLEELDDGGWRSISDGEWRKTLGEGAAGDRAAWVPKAIELCRTLGIREKAGATKETLLEDILVKGVPEGNCLVMTADHVDRRKRLYKVIDECGTILTFAKTKSPENQKHIFLAVATSILESRGKQLAPGALAALGRKTGFELRGALGELEKLILYTGEKTRIDEEDIARIAGQTKEDTVFDLTSAITERDLTKALVTIRYLFEHGVHYLMIVSMLAREVRLMLQSKLLVNSGMFPAYDRRMNFTAFKETVYSRVTGMYKKSGKSAPLLATQHPYVVYNAFRNAERFSYDQLVGYLERLAHIDVALKSTGKDPEVLLERLVTDMCASTG
jgi:DNA polymerase-3 subunit delta